MFRLALATPALLLVAACGGESNQEALQEAANQSDPAAAAVLNNAAEAGEDPQQALERAGQAAATASTDAGPPSGSVQAKPNLPQDPNRPTGGRPPEKVSTTNQATNEAANQNEHAGHNMQ